nr:hypothetical protein [Tanacetum cinerariifolium]
MAVLVASERRVRAWPLVVRLPLSVSIWRTRAGAARLAAALPTVRLGKVVVAVPPMVWLLLPPRATVPVPARAPPLLVRLPVMVSTALVVKVEPAPRVTL